MTSDTQSLFELLPAIHRIRDAELAKTLGLERGPLEELIGVLAEQIAVAGESLEQLHDDLFIETCADWAVPYIGDLIGYQSLHGVTPKVASARAEVAHTIALRRRMGTALVLEQLARDVTELQRQQKSTLNLVDDRADASVGAGAVLLSAEQKAQLQAVMWPDGKLSSAVIGQDATTIAQRAGLLEVAALAPRMLMVEETGCGDEHPFSGEKLSPVLTVYGAADLEQAMSTVERIYAYQGAGHSVSLHTSHPERALVLGQRLPVSRVIVNQAHAVATGGSFDNGLPFSLSMGCGTWGRNTFSDNMNYRHYLNITRVSRPIPERVPTEREIFGSFFDKYGAA